MSYLEFIKFRFHYVRFIMYISCAIFYTQETFIRIIDVPMTVTLDWHYLAMLFDIFLNLFFEIHNTNANLLIKF